MTNAGLAPEPYAVSSERGTLGIVVVTRQGIVIAADSRSTRGDGSYSDDAQKVFRIGDRLAGTIAGQVAWFESFFGHVQGFDFPESLREIEAKRRTIERAGRKWVVRSVEEEADWIGRKLSISLCGGLVFQKPRLLSDGCRLATLIVAGFAESPPWNLDNLEVTYEAEAYKSGLDLATVIGPTGAVRFEGTAPTVLRRYRYPIPSTGPFGMILNGNGQIVRGILETDHPALADSRRVPEIAHYLSLVGSRELETMTLDAANGLAKALIEESIRIAGRELGIGGQVDIANVTTSDGFRWVKGHEPDRKTRPAAPERSQPS